MVDLSQMIRRLLVLGRFIVIDRCNHFDGGEIELRTAAALFPLTFDAVHIYAGSLDRFMKYIQSAELNLRKNATVNC